MFGYLRADQIGVLVANAAQLGIDFSAAPALRDDGFKLGFAVDCAHGHLRAVIQQDAQFDDVVDRFSSQQRVRSAGIISDHSAQRAAAVRRGIGAERELIFFRAVAQRIQNDSRLHARKPPRRRRSPESGSCTS